MRESEANEERGSSAAVQEIKCWEVWVWVWGLGFGGLETRDLGMRVYDMDDAAGKRNAEIIRGWIRSTKFCFLKIDPASSSGCRRRGRGRGTRCGGVRLEAPSSTIDKSIWRRRFVCSCKLQLCHALKSIFRGWRRWR